MNDDESKLTESVNLNITPLRIDNKAGRGLPKDQALDLLVRASRDLSLARKIKTVTAITKKVARRITGADGVCFIFREGEFSFYFDEESIAPLWKGRKIPLTACFSGWTMLNQKVVIVDDIHLDSRIPSDFYHSTFVKSLVKIPIRRIDPPGAIGCYWAEKYRPAPEQVHFLEALADWVAIAIKQITEHESVRDNIDDRLRHLEAEMANLEAWSLSIVQKLRSQLMILYGFSQLLLEENANHTEEEEREMLLAILAAGKEMNRMLDDLMKRLQVLKAETYQLSIEIKTSMRAMFEDILQRQENFAEAINSFLAGEMSAAKKKLREYISETIGFAALAREMGISSGRIHPMLGLSGDPRISDFFEIIKILQTSEKVNLKVSVSQKEMP